MQGLAKLGGGHGKGAAHVVCGTLILCLMVTFCAETPQGLAKLVGDMEKALHTLRWCVEPLLLRCHILDAHAHTNKQTPIHTHVLSPAEMLLVSAACVWGVCVYVCVGVYLEENSAEVLIRNLSVIIVDLNALCPIAIGRVRTHLVMSLCTLM